MAFRSKVRSFSLHGNRFFSSSILSPDSKTPLSSKEKSRAALSLLRFEKNPERILEICRAAVLTPESHLDRVAYSKAMFKLKESHYYEGIRSFINDSLTRPDLKSERFVSHFIVLYGKAGLVKDAIKLFDEMPNLGVPNGVKALNSLLFSCILAGEYGEMKRVFSEFPRKYGLEPDLDTYNTVLKGFSESGSTNSAHSILAEMERKGVKPNATTFAVVIAGFYKEEKLNDVESMMRLMTKYGMRPNISIQNAQIQSLCKLKRSDEARALLDEIVSRGMKPNCVTYARLIYGFCKENKLDVAKSLYKEMVVDKKLKPESDCYFTLVYFLCQGRDFEAALDVCKDCMAKGWVPNITTMKMLVEGLISVEKVDEAREIIGVVCLHRYRFDAQWMFFFDVDEFIFVPKKTTIKSVLDSLSDFTQFTIEQMPMSNKICLSQDAPTVSRKWGFEKLVYRDVKRGVRKDRKYAVQPRNVFATGVHMSQNFVGRSTYRTEGRIKYFHYHGTIAERREPCRHFVNSTATTLDGTPYVYDGTMRDVAGIVKRFENKAIGSTLQRTRQ